MKLPANLVIQKFLRTYNCPFTVEDFSSLLAKIGIKDTKENYIDFLETNGNVFALADGKYVTRSYSFTGLYFSFKPTSIEIDRTVFIVGHRCIPFVDPEILSCGLKFIYNNTLLPTKIVSYPSSFVLKLFRLYGEEFSSQYIAADPSNEKINLADNDFLLPSKINVTSFSIEPIIQKEGFKYGDRLLCKVIDWDKGIIEISVLHHNENPFQMNSLDIEREKWYSDFETVLLNNLEIIGPCSSIEEQLALIFAEKGSDLCKKNCGSIEEFFCKSKKIDIEPFGVESRIWKKDEDVPAIGKWNYLDVRQSAENFDSDMFTCSDSSFIEDAFLKNMFFKESDNYTEVLEKMYPYYYKFSKKQREYMLLHLKNRHDILFRGYNRFADFEIGAIRCKALELYTIVNELVCSIDLAGADLALFSQQPLIVLSQIFGQIIRIMELLETNQSAIIKEINEISLSIEGMEFNFEGISSLLRQEIDRETRNGFSVVN